MSKRLIIVCLLAVAFLSSCQKNYNHYRDMIYGTWELVSYDGDTLVPKDTLSFISSSAMNYTLDGEELQASYYIYCKVLTWYVMGETFLQHEWSIETFRDSLFKADIVYRQIGDDIDSLSVGKSIVYRKLPSL